MPGPASSVRPGSSVARSRAAAVVAVLVLVPGLLVGCGSDSDPSSQTGAPSSAVPTGTPLPDPSSQVTNGVDERLPEEVLDEAVVNLLGLRSFRVSGAPIAGAPLDLVFPAGFVGPGRPDDAEAGSVGRGVRGTLTLDGSTFELIALDDSVYVRGNLDWLAEQVDEDARRTLGSTWLLLPEAAAERLQTVTDPEAFVRALLEPAGVVQAVGVSEIADEPAMGIRYVDTGATAWVAATGPVLPLLVERVGATATDGVLTFSDFDADVTLKAPRADAVVVVPDPGSGDPAG